MSKKSKNEIENGNLRVWLTSGAYIDLEVQYDNNAHSIHEMEDDLASKTGMIYLWKDLDQAVCLNLKAETIAGYEWLP